MKGHTLIQSGKWEGHDFIRKKFLKYPGPPPPPQLKTYLPLQRMTLVLNVTNLKYGKYDMTSKNKNNNKRLIDRAK